jgi:outer membrane immunogenic protein
MKTKLCMSMVVAGVAALSGSALADGYAGAAARPYSWTGIYVGGQGGFGEARSNFEFTNFFGTGVADQVHWPISGGFVGGMVGANYQVGAIVLGVQAEYNWADINGEQFDNFGLLHSAKLDNFGSVDGRVGVAIGRALGYVIGGWAWGDPRQKVQFGIGGPVESFDGGKDNGWDLGFGLEYAFWGGWTGRLEYRHYDFGSVSQPTLLGTPFLAHEEKMERVDTARLGIAYKFGADRNYLPLK